MDAGLALGNEATGSQVQGAQRAHHTYQVVVPEALQLLDRPTVGLRLAALRHRLDQPIRQLGRHQLRPRQLQGRTELAEHVAHAALASSQVEREVGSHPGPPQPGAVAHGVVQFPGGCHAVVDEVEHLAPEGLLEAIREVPLDLGANHQRVHDQVVIVGNGGIHGRLRGLPTGHDLDEGQQVDRVERMAYEDPFRMSATILESGRQEA